MHVELREGLENIYDVVFGGCTSLERICIPSTVKVISVDAFYHCTHLMHVELRKGLEHIDRGAFCGCTLLERISIPSTVHYIQKDVFRNCSSLVAVLLSEEIEEFVSAMALRPWWNNGTSNLSFWTGSFLARCNIPERVGMINFWVWKAQIHAMLQSIPSVMSFVNDDGNNRELENDYSFSINSRRANYEQLRDVAPLLELALWKAKIMEQCDDNPINGNVKLMCRIDSLALVNFIIPNVLSFL